MLRIQGDFDPEEVLRRVGWLDDADWWRKGDVQYSNRPAALASGFQLCVSDAGFDDLAGQVAHAVEFLIDELDEVRSITDMAGVEGVLDFGIAQHDLPAYFRRFPAQLVALIGKAGLGIELSLYAVSSVGGLAESPAVTDGDEHS